MERFRSSKTGSMVEGSGRLPSVLPEAEEFGDIQLQPPAAPPRGSKTRPDEPVEHYPRSPEGNSADYQTFEDPSFYASGNADDTEQYHQSFNHNNRGSAPNYYGQDQDPDRQQSFLVDSPVTLEHPPTSFNAGTQSAHLQPQRTASLGNQSYPSHHGDTYPPGSTGLVAMKSISRQNTPSSHRSSPGPGPSSELPRAPQVVPRVQPPVMSQGRDSLPSQQLRYSMASGGYNPSPTYSQPQQPPHLQLHDPSRYDNEEQDWPQEALLYSTRNDAEYP